MASATIVLGDHVDAEDVCRHEVGGELDTAEAEIQNLAQRAHEERFPESRNTLEQAMTTGEERAQHLLDDLLLTDDDLADLNADGVELVAKPGGPLFDGTGCCGHSLSPARN